MRALFTKRVSRVRRRRSHSSVTQVLRRRLITDALTAAAGALIPSDLKGFALDTMGDAFAALPEADRFRWRSIASVVGAYDGCGTEPMRGDTPSFASDWLAEASYRETLLDPEATHMGFVLRADGDGDGDGRKVALALVGQER